MNFYAVSALVNLIIGACLCLAILSKEKRNKIDLYFALFAFCACIWSTGYFFWQISSTSIQALFWTRFLIVGAIGIALTYLHFVLGFLNLTQVKYRLLRAINFLFFFLFVADFTPAMVSTVERRLSFSFWPVPGLAFHIFLVSWLGCIFYSTFLLYKAFAKSKGLFRKQIRTLFWAVSIGFLAGSVNFLLWYNIPVPPVTNILVSFYFILVFYAIIQYKFFNIKVVATQAFVLILLAATVWQLFLPDVYRGIWLGVGFIALILVAGIFLIRSVISEVIQKEKLQVLTKQLELANRKLTQLDKARAEFISIASHQLRTPPATMKWYLAAILHGDFGPIPEKMVKGLENTEMTNNSLISLIDDLLNASRIERGTMEFIFEPTDLQKITQITVNQLLPLARQKKQDLVFNLPIKTLPLVTADREKLRQVINNLIDNAIKYTPVGGTITVALAQDANDAVIKVSDTGKGVSKTEFESIFVKYDRGGKNTDSQGLGLGLYVAKVVVQLHKGKIWVESQGTGKGSIFIIRLPIQSKLKTSTYDLTKKIKTE